MLLKVEYYDNGDQIFFWWNGSNGTKKLHSEHKSN